ncbi:MAG TPA: VacB/RNase II family 3'-5' exoribonuclease, partial [Rhodospirillales bacterium]|nr:VacB/RNase II family 3'-5' exoribonuclease [Rhodospirillales bacterium]
IPLVTIDGADARDFDDAVWAEPDTDPKNPGGWTLMVAIADVSWYVRPGSPLDVDAYPRGNSVYFPDRVVPMLPEALSNGWCSLKPMEERPCLAVSLRIEKDGNLLSHRFLRGLMKSVARLTYEQVQAAQDGHGDETAGPIRDSVIAPLYGAYRALERGRKARGVLDLDLPERKVVVDKKGEVVRIETRARLDSHKLIEEFMITANVAAAKELEKRRQPCMYRIHDEPSLDKMENLRQFLGSLDIPFARGQRIEARQFNRILENAAGTPHAQMINDVVLRSQSQAEYNPDNIGHFGLALTHYCHFTSPIRRYSDLLVHRALISGLKLGRDGLEKKHRDYSEMGEHLSQTERRASGAERSAVDRFTAAYLSERIGAQFPGRINGATRFGLFVTLDRVGGDGLIPMRSLPDDYYIHEEAHHLLRGRNTGREFRLGDPIDVVLSEADPVTGGMIFTLAGEEGAAAPKTTRGRPGRRQKRRKIKKRNREKTRRPS